jgi:hypothetical protein
MTKEEKANRIDFLKSKAVQLKKDVDYYNALQTGLKLVLNGSYGAFAASYFVLFNNHVAGTITAEGRELTKKMDRDNEDYWYNLWHDDYELHQSLGIKNITPINKKEHVSIYGDSVDGSSVIITEQGKYTIEELYNKYNSDSIRKDKEVIPVDFKSLNWTNENNLFYSKVKNIIRHKTTKKKWKLKVNNKEIFVTDDHSLIVFRDGIKIMVKPNEIKKGDKVIVVKN